MTPISIILIIGGLSLIVLALTCLTAWLDGYFTRKYSEDIEKRSIKDIPNWRSGK